MKKSVRRYALGVELTLFLLISCTKDPGTPSGDLNGVYSGTYTQTGEANDFSYVKLVFVGSNFSGQSTDTMRSVCNGSYQITGDSIYFKNVCSTPDAELLLAGKYKMSSVGDSLYFRRDSPPDTIRYTELFSLKSQ